MAANVQSIINAISGSQQRNWANVCDDMIKRIEAMKPKDRLEYAACISDLVYAIAMSMQGWNQWYIAEFNKHFGTKPLSGISKKRFEEMFNLFKRTTIDILNLDMEFTHEFEEKMKKKHAKKKKVTKRKTANKQKTAYVA